MLEKRRIGQWEFNFSDYVLPLTIGEVLDGEALIKHWEKAFSTDTWTQRTLGKPAIIIRLDYVLRHPDESPHHLSDAGYHTAARIKLFEVEERPCGVGMGMVLHPMFQEIFPKLVEGWKRYGKIEAVISGERWDTCDDHEWTRLLCLPVHLGCQDVRSNGDAIYWIRANPWEYAYHFLAPNSLTTIADEGVKNYGIEMGLWKKIPPGFEKLPWDRGFAVKPRQGSRMQNIHLWNPPGKRKNGIATRQKIITAIREGQVHFYQEWIEPETHPSLQDYYLIRRVFFGWDICGSKWICLGGFYTARKNYRVHGASDSVMGLMIP